MVDMDLPISPSVRLLLEQEVVRHCEAYLMMMQICQQARSIGCSKAQRPQASCSHRGAILHAAGTVHAACEQQWCCVWSGVK